MRQHNSLIERNYQIIDYSEKCIITRSNRVSTKRDKLSLFPNTTAARLADLLTDMNKRRELVAKFHGVWRRYSNLVEQCSMSISSQTLLPHYKKQKLFMEEADIFLSIGSGGRTAGGLMSLASGDTVNPQSEYFCHKCPANWDEIQKELRAVRAALDLWAVETFAKQKVVIVTVSDELRALVQSGHHHISVSDDKKAAIKGIQQLLTKNRIEILILSVPENPVAKMICQEDDDPSTKTDLEEFSKSVFDAPFIPTKVDYNKRIED